MDPDTLERQFRDLIWSAAADKDARDDHVAAAGDVRAILAKRHPEACGRFDDRLRRHLELVEKLVGNRDDAIMRPIVVNRHHYRTDGELDPAKIPKPNLYIGRGTALGNPYKLKDHGVEALELYKKHLWGKLQLRDTEVLRAMGQITWDICLVCSCAPRPCHGDVVRDAWVWLQDQPWWVKRRARVVR